MRARNREINIFNMSLLDILTGMLGAFLFMMVGMVPFYAKVMNSQLITAEERKKLDELKKLLEKGLKGPLTPEEVDQLKDEMARLEAKNQQLQSDNDQLNNQLTQTKQELDQTKESLQTTTQERNFWKSEDASFGIVSAWDSAKTDIDVMVWGPDGRVWSPKKERFLGKDIGPDGNDSHGQGDALPQEGVVVRLKYLSGDYLVFYRVPKDADPASYKRLLGFISFRQTEYKSGDDGFAYPGESGLGDPRASLAKPGGLYAWATVHFDNEKHTIGVTNPPTGKLPEGIQLPH